MVAIAASTVAYTTVRLMIASTVHEAIADDGRGEGEWHQGEQYDEHAEHFPGLIAEGVGQAVEHRERQGTGRRPRQSSAVADAP